MRIKYRRKLPHTPFIGFVLSDGRGMARIHVYRDTRFFMKAYCFSAMQGRRERHGLLKRRLRRLCLKRPYPAELPRGPWLPHRFFCRFFGPCRGLAVLKSLPLPGFLFPERTKRQENQCQRLKKQGFLAAVQWLRR